MKDFNENSEENTTIFLENTLDKIRKLIDPFCSEWIIKGIIKKENQIRFSNNLIDISKFWDEIKIHLFMAKNRRTIEMDLSNLSIESIKKTINYCNNLLNKAEKNRFYKYIPEDSFTYNYNIQGYIYDEKVEKLGEEATDIVNNAIQASLEAGAHRTAGSFYYGTNSFTILTSTGIKGLFKRSRLNFRIRAFAEDMYATGESLSLSTHLEKNFDAINAGKEAGEICKKAIGGEKGIPGIYNIIIYPKVSTELQATTPAIAMNSYVKKMGISWLTGKKEGDQISKEDLSVWDDGTMRYGTASGIFDDEGVPTSRTLLIDKGRIKKFFTNTSLSEKSQKSTGNAGITMPKPTNTVFSSGDCTLKELMEISENPTLLITSVWYTRYQSYAPPGIFSSLPKDGMFLVKSHGQTLEPIRDLRINSDQYQMLDNIVALGKEQKQVATWLSPSNNTVFAPFMLIKDIRMTTGTK
ncbi:MAG: TldD/PmbA family protein [Candidatus Lokiarchaeota archaeon]